MADLQDIVDDLEAEIQRPISVEDRRWRLLAHSAQPDETDPVRMQSILSRETAPDVAAWLEGLGLQRARELVDLPENPALGMTRRGVLPLRHGDVLLGFLWVIVGDRPLTDVEREALKRGAGEAADNLWGRLRTSDERRQRVQAALTGDPADLAAALRWPPTGSFAVALSAPAAKRSPSSSAAAAARPTSPPSRSRTASSSSPAIPTASPARCARPAPSAASAPVSPRSTAPPTPCARPRPRRWSPAPPRSSARSRPTASSAVGA